MTGGGLTGAIHPLGLMQYPPQAQELAYAIDNDRGLHP